MRRLGAGLLGLVALLLTALALPATWTERHVVDEDGYVAFTAPLGSDRAFQSALAGVVAEAVVDNTRVPDVAKPAIQKAAAGLTTLDGFDEAWRTSNRRSHEATFADARDLPPELNQSNRLAIDVAPLARLVVDRVSAATGTSLSAPDQAVLEVGGSNQQRRIEQLKTLDPLAYLLAAAAVAVGAGAVLAARSRGAAVGWLGAGAVVVAGILELAAKSVVPEVVARNTPPSQAAARLQVLLQDAATDSFDRWLLVTAVVGALAAVAGGVGRAVSPSSR